MIMKPPGAEHRKPHGTSSLTPFERFQQSAFLDGFERFRGIQPRRGHGIAPLARVSVLDGEGLLRDYDGLGVRGKPTKNLTDLVPVALAKDRFRAAAARSWPFTASWNC
jgi:hypothetical protein